MLNASGSSPITNFAATGAYPYPLTTATPPSIPILDTHANQPIDTPPPPTDQLGIVYYPGMENTDQPMFDLNDLQNFFEWENGENGPPPTGVDGLGPLGWNNLSSLQ